MSKLELVYVWVDADEMALEDLRFSLRSVERHCLPNYRITIVGDKPTGMGGVLHAPMERKVNVDHPKAYDAVWKMEKICGIRELQERFCLMYDDVHFIADFDELFLSVRRAVKEIPKDFELHATSRKHTHAKRETVKALREAGFNRIWDYETHLPRMFEKRKMLEVIHTYKALERRLLLPTLYFNHHYKHQEPELLSKFDNVKVNFAGHGEGTSVPPANSKNPELAIQYYRPFLVGKTVWNHNNRGMKDYGLQCLRHALFPEQSHFEKKPVLTLQKA